MCPHTLNLRCVYGHHTLRNLQQLAFEAATRKLIRAKTMLRFIASGHLTSPRSD